MTLADFTDEGEGGGERAHAGEGADDSGEGGGGGRRERGVVNGEVEEFQGFSSCGAAGQEASEERLEE